MNLKKVCVVGGVWEDSVLDRPNQGLELGHYKLLLKIPPTLFIREALTHPDASFKSHRTKFSNTSLKSRDLHQSKVNKSWVFITFEKKSGHLDYVTNFRHPYLKVFI